VTVYAIWMTEMAQARVAFEQFVATFGASAPRQSNG
jgi:hypothetical protein